MSSDVRKQHFRPKAPAESGTGTEARFLRAGKLTAVLDAHEASAYLGISETTLHRMIRRGDLPHTRIGRVLRFRILDLDAYLEANTTRESPAEDPTGSVSAVAGE